MKKYLAVLFLCIGIIVFSIARQSYAVAPTGYMVFHCLPDSSFVYDGTALTSSELSVLIYDLKKRGVACDSMSVWWFQIAFAPGVWVPGSTDVQFVPLEPSAACDSMSIE